jgi:hypothetical protein
MKFPGKLWDEFPWDWDGKLIWDNNVGKFLGNKRKIFQKYL